MRITLTSLHFLFAAACAAQSWSVSPGRALIWNGEPYQPIGWSVTGTPQTISAAVETGIKDFLVELSLSSDWTPVTSILENSNARYLLADSSIAPRASGFIVRPSSYRIDNVGRTGEFTIPIENGKSVFYLLLALPDYSVAKSGWSEVVSGTAKISVNERISGGGFVLLLFPKVTKLDMPDFWEKLDEKRDTLLSRLAITKTAPGLRGIVNPVGDLGEYTDWSGLVPDSPLFRLEFEAYLRSTYRDIAALERAWKLTSVGVKDFKSAARLIALFGKTSRGVDFFLDPENNVLIPADRNGSTYWSDILTILESTAQRRMQRFADALSSRLQVPVVFEWNGWSPIYCNSNAAGAGIGLRFQSGGLDLPQQAAGAASTVISWNLKRWLVATDVTTGDYSPFQTEESLCNALIHAAQLGARAWFVRWTGGSEAAWIRSSSAEVMSIGKPTEPSRAVLYPENARFPAITMQLPGGVWWLPTPVSGERIDLGPNYEGYRHVSKFSSFTAIWRVDGPMKSVLKFRAPETAILTRYDGSPVEKKIVRDGIEVMMDTLPMIIHGTDEIPAPVDAIELARADYQSLVRAAKQVQAEIGNDRFAYEEALRKLDRNPGVSLMEMTDALRNMMLKIAPYIWIEGEAAFESTFGEVTTKTATSGGRALNISSGLRVASGHTAKYRIKVTNDHDEVDVWLAARIPADVRPYVTIELAGSRLGLGDSQNAYSQGFAWYKAGKISLRKGSYTLTVRISEAAPRFEAGLDAILITPVAFRPQGPKPPRFVPGG